MKKIYYFTIISREKLWDFGETVENNIQQFENLCEAFKAWKESRQADGYWPDAYEKVTSDLKAEWLPDEPVWHKHGLMIGHEPTEAERKEFREFKKGFFWEEIE